MDNHFLIIVTVYNSVNYIERCLTSIASQEYVNYRVIVIDDCSTDGTWDKIQAYYRRPFTLIRNYKRNGSALGNIAYAIHAYVADKECIICLVDGDDFLAYNAVLSDLNEVYQEVGVYMTYGQFVPLSGKYEPYCRHIPDTRTYRTKKQWYAGHLRTFKKKLWDAIDDKDLRDATGEYYKAGGDGAYLYPMVEICGHKHMRFIEKVNYIYNDLNPLNDMKIAVKEQLATSDKLHRMPAYAEIDEL